VILGEILVPEQPESEQACLAFSAGNYLSTYTLQVLKRGRLQIPSCTWSRAAEYHDVSAAVVITPVRPRQSASETCSIARPFQIVTETQKAVNEALDRLERPWDSRRFTYGGRRFVWKKNKSIRNHMDTPVR
jgi:hypothetical protein